MCEQGVEQAAAHSGRNATQPAWNASFGYSSVCLLMLPSTSFALSAPITVCSLHLPSPPHPRLPHHLLPPAAAIAASPSTSAPLPPAHPLLLPCRLAILPDCLLLPAADTAAFPRLLLPPHPLPLPLHPTPAACCCHCFCHILLPVPLSLSQDPWRHNPHVQSFAIATDRVGLSVSASALPGNLSITLVH